MVIAKTLLLTILRLKLKRKQEESKNMILEANKINNRKMTDDEFKEKVKKIYGDEYIPQEKYVNSSTKIKIFHNKCQNIILKRPNDLLSGYQCNVCNKYHKKTNEEFIDELQKAHGDDYIALEEYKDANTEIFFKHKCNTVFLAKPYRVLYGENKCPKCKENPTPDEEEIKEKIKSRKDRKDYLLVSGYKSMHKEAVFLHTKCKKTFKKKPTEFFDKRHTCPCPFCANTKYTTATFCDKVLKDTDGKYLVLGQYINNKTKITMEHLKCEHVWDVRPDTFLHGTRCPKCSSSKGNAAIRKFLECNNIKHEGEHKIKECRNKRVLPFDFAILDADDNIKLLIEYQGREHYEIVDAFGGEEGFIERNKHDLIKSEYCTKNNIDLFTIHYKHYKNINNLLKQKLKEIFPYNSFLI